MLPFHRMSRGAPGGRVQRTVFGLSAIAAMASLGIFGAFAVTENACAGATQLVLVAEVDAAGHATLRLRDGTQVVTVRGGVYSIVVRDRSSRQNFHLKGPDPSLDRKTGVKFVGTVKWQVSLAVGLYRYFSDRNPATRRSFRVIR